MKKNRQRSSYSYIATFLLLITNAAFAAPATLVQTVTYNSETITMRLTKENLRGANFELLMQNSTGGYDVTPPVDERSYIGSVDEYPGAVASGILLDNGDFKGAVYFDRGATWYTLDTTVSSTEALDYSTFSNFKYPTASSVLPDQAGTDMYGFDVGVDVSYDYYNQAGATAASTFERIEYSASCVRAIFMRDALLKQSLGRVIIRADQTQDPYDVSLTLGNVDDEWEINQTSADRDVVCGVDPSFSGGLAWVGSIGTGNGYSANNANSAGEFHSVWRHELGHNWGSYHSVGGSPEGTGIMGGNQPARFSGCELYSILTHRDNRVSTGGIIDNQGAYSAINLPPYAALDPVSVEIETGKVEFITIDVLANDFDANGHSFTLDSFSLTSHLGFPVTRSIGTGTNGQDELIYSALGGSSVDHISYTVIDSSGQTATGYAVINSKGVVPQLWKIQTDADAYTQVNSSLNYGDRDYIFLKNAGASSSYTRAGWVHFDISGKTFANAAELEFTAEVHGDDPGYIDIWGLVDGQNGDDLDSDWTELGLTHSNAPHTPNFVEGANTTYIGRLLAPTSQSKFQLSTAELLAFLQADTNGEVTFLLLREEGADGGDFSLRTKESPNGGAATLSTYFSTNSSLGTDTYVRDGSSANTNYGSDGEMLVKNDGVGYTREAYLRFDNTGVDKMSSSRTILTLTPTFVQTGQTYRLRLVDDAGDGWEELAMTWNNRPVGSGAGITFSAADLTVGVPYQIDVTDLITLGNSENGAVTIHIDGVNQISADLTRFASRENATAAYRPTLKITDLDVHDAYVRLGSHGGTNYGGTADLVLKNETDTSYQREFYLRRSYECNNGGPIAAATLTMTPTGTGAGRTIRLRLLDDADDTWLENVITGNERPTGTGAEVNFLSDALSVGQAYDIDVTSLLNQAGNENGVASFHVDTPGVASSAYIGFASKEHATPAYHPVLNVNPNVPSASDAILTFAEDSQIGTSVGTVIATDADADNTLSYAITAGNTGSGFTINATTGEITTAVAFDFETATQYALTVTVSDDGTPSLSDTATITVNVTNVNEAIIANDTSGTLAEDAAIGSAVASVTISDTDAGDSVSFAITSGNTDNAFAIDTNGNITTATALDFETTPSYSLTVTATDGGGLSDSATVTISVTDIVEGPIDSDGDGHSDALELAVGSDPNNASSVPASYQQGLLGRWQMNEGTGNLTADSAGGNHDGSLTAATWGIGIEGSGLDFDGTTSEVNIDGVVTGTSVTIDAWIKPADLIGQQSIMGRDDSFTFKLSGSELRITTPGILNHTTAGLSLVANEWQHVAVSFIAGQSGGVKFYRNGQLVSTQNASSMNVNTNAVRLGGNQWSEKFQGSMDQVHLYGDIKSDADIQALYDLFVNNAPIADDETLTIAEDAVIGSVLGTVSAADAGDTLSYAITSGNSGGEFAINTTTGEITSVAAFDFETATQYALTVTVSDDGAPSLSDTATITVNVTNVNEAIVANDNSGTLAEDATIGSAVATVTTSDPDAGDSVSFAITGGNTGNAFAIDTNGNIRSATALDFETTPSYSLTVTATDGGGLSDTATVTVTVTNVNEAIVANDNSGTLAEDAANGSAVARVITSDPDAGDSVSFAITGGNTGNAFAIDTNGNITSATALDFETTASYSLTVTATDGGGYSDTATVSVTITDVVETTAPVVATGSASNLATTTADIGYSITDDGGEAPSVTLYYGENDGGTTPGNWTNNVAVGAQATGSYVESLTGLTEGTSYYFTIAATNSVGSTWGSTGSFDTTADSTPKMVRTTVNAVSSTNWTTVDLGQNYTSAVIVATPIYADSTQVPVVSRIRNVSGSSFDLKLDRADGLTAETICGVSVIAVEEGVYTLAVDNVKMEAVKFTSTITGNRSGWNAEACTYQNSYTTPVVVGQVMSANDANWSTFWSMGSSRLNPADSSNLNVGKHVAEDPNATRANETIGYIVIESGTGTINGVAYTAAVGADIVRNYENSASGYSYSLTGLTSASAAALSSTAMDGTDGAWPVLNGVDALSSTSVKLIVDEDQLKDSERKHATEQINYIIFE